MSVLDRASLEASPLADLHAIASELGLDGFRRMRKAQLVDAILERGGGEAPDAGEAAAVVEAAEEGVTDEGEAKDPEPDREVTERERSEAGPARSRSRRRGGRGRGRDRSEGSRDEADEEAPEPDQVVEGVVELLGNGSGFVRVSPPEPSDDDVYVSAAQVRRCELVSGDRVAGPVRRPRRSERFPSLVRVDTINGSPADEVAEGTRYDELRVAFPTERFPLSGEDPTLKAIEWLTPFGRGSRVTLVGGPRAGKTEALRRLAAGLAAVEGLDVFLVLAGARPEEVAEWSSGPVVPAGTATMDASPDSQDQIVEAVVEQGRRIAARGGNAVVLIDSLQYLHDTPARRALGAARNVLDGGSLTVIATAPRPVGGETTVIAFDSRLACARRFPAIDVAASGSMRPELLVGEAGAEAIARAHAEALPA